VASASINSLSGQIHASSQALSFQQEGIVNRTLADRLSDPGASNQSGAWFQGTGVNGNVSSAGYASGKYSGGGAMTGYDLPLSPNLIAGAALTWNNLSATYSDDTGTSTTRSSGFSLYGRYAAGNAYVTGRVGQDWLTSDVNRWALLGDTVNTIASQRNDQMTSAYGEAGYHFTSNGTSLTPFASLGYDHLNRGSINESGAGGFGLTAGSEGFAQTDGQVGARLTRDWVWSGGHTYLSGYALYQRIFSGSDLAFNAAYAGAPNATFSVEGVNSPRNSAWAGLGVTTQLRGGWSWFLNLDGQVSGGDTNAKVVSAGVRVSL